MFPDLLPKSGAYILLFLYYRTPMVYLLLDWNKNKKYKCKRQRKSDLKNALKSQTETC